jgi:hypothetical protein
MVLSIKLIIKWVGWVFFLMLVLSAYLVISNEINTMLAWWLTTLLLLPGLIYALRTQILSTQILSLIIFCTQFVTLPIFFIHPERYTYYYLKPFFFTVYEVFKIMYPVGLFMILLVWFTKIIAQSVNYSGYTEKYITDKDKTLKKIKFLDPSINSWIYVSWIVIVITLITPLNLWMFKHGIGIVGVESPTLPYRMTGLLYYSTKYIIPLLLGYLYSKTMHGVFPTLMLISYALILGLSDLSRSALVLVMLPVLTIVWLERKWLLLAMTSSCLLFFFLLITAGRNFVYTIIGNKSEAITSDGVFGLLDKLLIQSDIDFSIIDILGEMLGRIESFQNLVMASQFDANAVGGKITIILRLFWQRFAPWDLDEYHLAWMGYTLPEGYVNIGSFLSQVLMASHGNLLLIVLIAALTALILITLESSITILAGKYKLPQEITLGGIGILTITFFIDSGSNVFFFPFMFLIIMRFMPTLFVVNFAKRY